MFSIRQVSLLGIGAALLMTGCGQVAANAPIATLQGKTVAASGTIRVSQESVTRAIKAQFENAFFKFRDLSVSALPYQNVHTFRGIADITTRAGIVEYTVYGRYDLTSQKATIAYKVAIKSNRWYSKNDGQADDVLDLTADAPTLEQAKLDIKDQLEKTGVRAGSYSVISGIHVAIPDLAPTMTATFTAHEREVGHGWEVRYSVVGTYDSAIRKAIVAKRERTYSSGVRPWTLAL